MISVGQWNFRDALVVCPDHSLWGNLPTYSPSASATLAFITWSSSSLDTSCWANQRAHSDELDQSVLALAIKKHRSRLLVGPGFCSSLPVMTKRNSSTEEAEKEEPETEHEHTGGCKNLFSWSCADSRNTLYSNSLELPLSPLAWVFSIPVLDSSWDHFSLIINLTSWANWREWGISAPFNQINLDEVDGSWGNVYQMFFCLENVFWMVVKVRRARCTF